MSAIDNIRRLYDEEVKRSGADRSKGLKIGPWTRIIREGLKNYSGADNDIAETFLQADTSGDQLLTFDEFYACMTKPHLDEKKLDEVEELFKKWDKSGDSKLTKDEVRQAVGKYREDTIERILKEADQDGDGFISVDEFKTKLFGKK